MRAALAVAAVSLVPAAGWAQMHAVKKPETVVRAVGVYEWTGELAKPTASRLIPVTIFIDGHLEDAGVYLARPVPMALQTGTLFELDDAGKPRGLLDLAFARHLQPAETSTSAPYDDGWFGYGQYKAQAAPKLAVASKTKVRQSKTAVESSKADTARPHLSNKSDTAKTDTADASEKPDAGKTDSSAKTSSGSSTTAAADPDRPTMRRRDDAGTSDSPASSSPSATTTAKDTPPADPDRPTMKRRTDDTSGDSSGSKSTTTTSSDDADRPTMKRRTDSGSSTASSTSSTPADDPDRPVLKRKSTEDGVSTSSDTKTADSKADQKTDTDTDADRPTMKRRTDSSSDSTASTPSTPADDPDRPTLKKRTPAERKAAQKANSEASVSGMGSLNDDPNRPSLHRGKPTHALNEDDLPKMIGLPADLKQMVAVSDAVNRPEHDFSRPWESAAEHEEILGKMRALATAKLLEYAPVPAVAAAPAKAAPVAKTAAARAAAARKAKAAAAAKPQVVLSDEVLKGYVLSYGGAATYAFSASMVPPPGAAAGTPVRYVTVVTQADANGELKPALENVTDAQHLDRTARMRLVDVVDAEASNRASLLFELRAQQSRSFALYRLIGAEAEQTFSTGSTQ
jgi:hypothetical protein